MVRGDLLLFLRSTPTRTLFFFILGLIVFQTGYHLLNLHFSAVYYMWILIRGHGRLRVPRQAKFLSCKYSIYWPLIN